jgi:carboxymethylenebutenolidase
MATNVKFSSKAGAQLEGAFAEPGGSAKHGALVVVQEWFGINDHMKALCDRFAQAGFLALAPDLYHGKVVATADEAGKMMQALDKKKAVGEIGDAVAFLHGHGRANGKVAVTGFCLGGALTLAAAASIEGLSAAVPFYGIPDLPMEAYAKIKAPIQAHFAKKDDWAKASAAQEIQNKVRSGGGHMDLFVYDAGHAFMRSNDPHVYDAESARLAWDRAVEFLRKHLHA